MEDITMAQAILDLSIPLHTHLPHIPHEEEGLHHMKTEDPMDTASVYKLNGGKTTTYTYEAFFASDGRSKK